MQMLYWPEFCLRIFPFSFHKIFFSKIFFDKSDMILSLDKIENLDISSHHFSIKSCSIKDPVIFRFRNIYYCFKNDQFFLKFCHFIKKNLCFPSVISFILLNFIGKSWVSILTQPVINCIKVMWFHILAHSSWYFIVWVQIYRLIFSSRNFL